MTNDDLMETTQGSQGSQLFRKRMVFRCFSCGFRDLYPRSMRTPMVFIWFYDISTEDWELFYAFLLCPFAEWRFSVGAEVCYISQVPSKLPTMFHPKTKRWLHVSDFFRNPFSHLHCGNVAVLNQLGLKNFRSGLTNVTNVFMLDEATPTTRQAAPLLGYDHWDPAVLLRVHRPGQPGWWLHQILLRGTQAAGPLGGTHAFPVWF